MVNLTRERARMVNVQIAGRGITARQVLNTMHEYLMRRHCHVVDPRSRIARVLHLVKRLQPPSAKYSSPQHETFGASMLT